MEREQSLSNNSSYSPCKRLKMGDNKDFDQILGATSEAELQSCLTRYYNLPPSAGGFRKGMYTDGYGVNDDEFWPKAKTVSYGNLVGRLAICPDSENPRLFMLKKNKAQGEEGPRHTKISLSVADAEALLLEIESLLKEMDSTPVGMRIPTLAKMESLAALEPSDKNFWDKCWIAGSNEVRCRPFVAKNEEFTIVVNSPRTIATPKLKDWKVRVLSNKNRWIN